MSPTVLTDHLKQRPLDVTSIENALVDMLLHSHDEHIESLQLNKGSMRLVDAAEQLRILQQLGHHKPEVEVGGSAANVLRALSLLGGQASYSSVVGDDSHGKAFSKRLADLAIRDRLVYAEGPTGTCLVLVSQDGERTMNTHLGVCTSYRSEHLPKEDIAQSKIFFTTGYAWDTTNQKDAIREALSCALENKALIALDVADSFVVERSGQELRSVIKQSVDIVFANSDESMILTGAKGLEGAQRLGQWARLAIVKDGAGGSYISFEEKITHVAAPSVQVVDTTGAGDFYAGGFLFGICKGLSPELSGHIATAMGSDTVGHLGVRHSANITEKVKESLRQAGADPLTLSMIGRISPS